MTRDVFQGKESLGRVERRREGMASGQAEKSRILVPAAAAGRRVANRTSFLLSRLQNLRSA